MEGPPVDQLQMLIEELVDHKLSERARNPVTAWRRAAIGAHAAAFTCEAPSGAPLTTSEHKNDPLEIALAKAAILATESDPHARSAS